MSDSTMQNNVQDVTPGGTMTHAKIPLPKAQVSPKHPFRNKLNHDRLRSYLQQRLLAGRDGSRDSELNRLVQIDKNVAGWMRLSDDDKERQRKNHKDGIPLATQLNLPLAFVHLDDMMTYFAATFSPNRGMFYQAGDADDQDPARQIVTLMNNHAIYAGYYREVLLGIYSLLKYNSGGFHVYWAKDSGPTIIKDAQNQDVVQDQLKWQGNRLEAIDKYNFICDPAVHPTKLYCDGEFAATIRAKSYFWLQNKASKGIYFNCDDAMQDWSGTSQYTYYRNPPEQAQFEADLSGGTDWKAILGGRESTSAGANFELAEVYIKLNPTEWGLIDGNASVQAAHNRYELWRFTLLNDRYIIEATYMNNIHGQIPYYMGVFNDDSMGTSQKSPAEILTPLQNFASSLLNTHIQASRKKLWGLTVYDPTMVDLKSIPEGEVAARIPMNPAAYGRDIRTGIWSPPDNSDTNQTMDDLSKVMDIINQFFPTQSAPSAIASIDRAVDSQVAAVQQGANRREQKAARLLDDTVFRPVRSAMYYNIIQYQPDESVSTDYYTGKPITIDIAALRNTDLPFIIGQGLKALDRQAAAKNMQQIIFALIQAPAAAQQIDLVGLIDFWTDMIDVDINMKQFILPPPAPAATGAPQIDPTTGQPIVPATNPGALEAPLRHNGAGAGQ